MHGKEWGSGETLGPGWQDLWKGGLDRREGQRRRRTKTREENGIKGTCWPRTAEIRRLRSPYIRSQPHIGNKLAQSVWDGQGGIKLTLTDACCPISTL